MTQTLDIEVSGAGVLIDLWCHAGQPDRLYYADLQLKTCRQTDTYC